MITPSKLEGNVLLVDDEEQFLEVLTARLKIRGLTVDSVMAGEDALARIDEESFDAIVLDLAMPGLGGIETLRRLKEKQPDLQIIMLTGQATVKSSIEAMKLGAEDFLEKPLDLNVLLEKIREAKNKRMLLIEKSHQAEVGNILKSKNW
ncbi:MAG: two-component system response regulator [Deltaproteobacteria bacterium RIFOXYD12_FULL_57_12]|nr:MAG: two-component system response regulator [Deltaproteobacteria bacterium RIFOXYD12_FULL_57_12]